MKISQKTIDEIFNTVVIEEVISDFVNLKKTGANYKGLSPFNDEKTPSFVVSPAKEIWKDFSSGKGGNVISFLIEHEQYSYPEALLFLAKKYNIDVQYDKIDSKSQEKENERQAIFIVLKFVKNNFIKKLFENQSTALDYLKSRGFLKSTIDKFEIGYCPERDHKSVSETQNAGYNTKYLHHLRIINEQEKNRFSGRIMFPIHSITGEVVGFGGRILNKKLKGVKYLNSDSSNLYQKSKILYGMHIAKYAIKKLDFCYIVEGYTDVMALHQFGIENVVSSCGTALTKEQIRLIHRFTNNIVILFDSDTAGVNATLKAIDAVLIEDMHPKILQFPQGEDPASFILKNDENEIKKYISYNTIDFIEFKHQLLTVDDTNEMIKNTNSILMSISYITDPISKTFYIRRASKKLNIKEADLILSLKNLKSDIKTNKKVEKSNIDYFNLSDIKKHNLEELQLIRLLINYGSVNIQPSKNIEIPLAQFIIKEIEKEHKDLNIQFSVSIFNAILLDIKDKLKHEKKFSKDDFLNHDNPQFRSISSTLIGDKYLLSNWEEKDIIVVQEQDILFKVAKEAILRFKLKSIQNLIQGILVSLKKESESDQSQLIVKFSQLSIIEKKIQQKLGRIF